MNKFIVGFVVALIILNPKTTIHITSAVLNTANGIVSRFSYDINK